MARTSLHPIQTLRDHAVELEAAITLTLAKPKKSAVHKLRSQTRRLEAQLALLAQLSAVPPHTKEAEALTRKLGKVRRVAGQVRDLDVQRELLKTHPGLPREAAAELRDDLRHKRVRKARKLHRLLLKQLPRIAAALEQLVQSVGTANGLVLPEVRLVPLIEKWKQAQDEAVEHAGHPEELDDDQLHTTRKAAKAARYMAESGADSAQARRAAARYEAQQDAGGRWHDWLDLAATAREHFGARHALTRSAMAQCEAARAEYVKLLR